MEVKLVDQLAAFSRAVVKQGDDTRVTLRGKQLLTDAQDVGVLKRFFRPEANAQQIQENNAVRTALLNALSDQFGGRKKIPASVLKALNGSSLRGKSDMSATGGQVTSGRPLTARRIRAILGQVMVELTNQTLQEKNPQIGLPGENSGTVKTQPKEPATVKTQPKEPTTVRTEESEEVRDPSEKDNRALGEFRKRMRTDGDARVWNGIDREASGKDPVTRYAESFCREVIIELVDEDYEEAQEFWRNVGLPDPTGEAEVDDVTREFARGLDKNQEVFDKLSQAIRAHICSGGTPQGLKDVRMRVISDALKVFREKNEPLSSDEPLSTGKFPSLDEPLPLNGETIFGFKTGMSQKEIDDVESLVRKDASRIGHDAKWFNAYTQRTIENLQKNAVFASIVQGSVDKTTADMFQQAIQESRYVFDQVHDVTDDSIRHGKTHAEVQGDVQNAIADFLLDFSARRNAASGTESKGEIAPRKNRKPAGLDAADKLPPGVVLSQGQNTCPIIGLTNAMLMTSGETAGKAKDFMVRHREGTRSYFEFPHPDKSGKNIRAYTDEFGTMFKNNRASLSDFEKAVFVALKKAGLEITNDTNETQPGEIFEISPVFVLFGFKEPEFIGNVHGDRPSEMQQCQDGQKIAEAIKAGKPCVLRMPGHFVGIEGVKFDERGLPTYTYFDSASKLRGTLQPADNAGYQFYIGEGTEAV